MNIETALVSEIAIEKERMLARYLTPVLSIFVDEMYDAAEEKGLTNDALFSFVRAFTDWPPIERAAKVKRLLSYLRARFKHFEINEALRARIIASVCVHSASQSRACGTKVVVPETVVDTFVLDLMDAVVTLVAEEKARNLGVLRFRKIAQFAVSDAVIDLLSKHRFAQRDVLVRDEPTLDESEEPLDDEEMPKQPPPTTDDGVDSDAELETIFPRAEDESETAPSQPTKEAGHADTTAADDGAGVGLPTH